MSTAPAPTLAAASRQAFLGSRTYDVTLVAAGSMLIGLLAWVRVPLPFTPVPITGSTLGVLLVAGALGSRRGVAAVILYLAQGAAGMPVFAGGAAGLAYMRGATGGYLVGFVLAALIVGVLTERGWDRRTATLLFAMSLATAVIFATGCLWLIVLGFATPGEVLVVGLLPFIPGAVVKVVAATALIPLARRWRMWGER